MSEPTTAVGEPVDDAADELPADQQDQPDQPARQLQKDPRAVLLAPVISE